MRKKGLRRFVKENLFQSEGSAELKAKSIALGVFIGFSPFWGLHTILAISLSALLRLNKTLTFISAQITVPPLLPIVLYVSMLIGAPFVGSDKSFSLTDLTLEVAKLHLIQYAVGSLILATAMALILGLLSFLLLRKSTPVTKPESPAKKARL